MQTATVKYNINNTIITTTDSKLTKEWHQITNEKREKYSAEIHRIENLIEKLKNKCKDIHKQQIQLKKQPFTKFFTLNYYKKYLSLDNEAFDATKKLDILTLEHLKLKIKPQIPISELENKIYKLMTKHGYHLHQKTDTTNGLIEIWHKN